MWILATGSVTGRSHITKGVPCQDKFETALSADGRWSAVVLSDGAGSAKRSELGASIVSKYFCSELILLAELIDEHGPGQWINDRIIECALEVRRQLREVAEGDDLSDFHCTLVAALAGDSGGFAIQIGDGLIIGGAAEQHSSGKKNEISIDFISKPENGEYANETFFITEPRWLKHIRITPFGSVDWLLLCTDGVSSYLLDGRDDLVDSSFSWLFDQLTQAHLASVNVQKILMASEYQRASSDDKTLVLMSKRDWSKTRDIVNNLKKVSPTGINENAAVETELQENIADRIPSEPSFSTQEVTNGKRYLGVIKKNLKFIRILSKPVYIKIMSIIFLLFVILIIVISYIGSSVESNQALI